MDFPFFNHSQSSAFLCDLCASAVKIDTQLRYLGSTPTKRQGWQGAAETILSIIQKKAGQANPSGFGENLRPHHCDPDEYQS
jgi:hypothetical protein